MEEKYKCQSYYGDDNLLKDCTCGKCEPTCELNMPPTNTNEEWENELMTQFCVMLDRADRENGESSTEWQEKLENFISQQKKEAYNEGIEDSIQILEGTFITPLMMTDSQRELYIKSIKVLKK